MRAVLLIVAMLISLPVFSNSKKDKKKKVPLSRLQKARIAQKERIAAEEKAKKYKVIKDEDEEEYEESDDKE